jgi:hypothetical protein
VAPTNGQKDSNETFCNTTVKFSCDACYELIGASQLICLPNQTWSSSEPICKVRSCPALVSPSNGRKNSEDTLCNSTVEFICDACYELIGDSRLTCLPNQTWSNSEPSCNGSYTCLCPQGTVFLNGSCRGQCTSSPCQNSGTCIDLVDGFECECIAGYEGVSCGIDTNECMSLPCQNDGVCEDGINRYTCNCSDGFEGLDCDVLSSGIAGSDNTTVIVASVGVALVCLLLLIAIILYKKRHPSRVAPCTQQDSA